MPKKKKMINVENTTNFIAWVLQIIVLPIICNIFVIKVVVVLASKKKRKKKKRLIEI